MSFRADASGTTSLPSALEHALASGNEIVVGGLASSMIPCNIHEVSERFHESDGLDNGTNSIPHQQECLEGIQMLRPTAPDSDEGLDSQQTELFGEQNSCDLAGFETVGEDADKLFDKGSLAPQLDEGIDWLLRMNEDDATSRDLCTEQLRPDLQRVSEPVRPVLPGFGVDHSRWALEVSSPIFSGRLILF